MRSVSLRRLMYIALLWWGVVNLETSLAHSQSNSVGSAEKIINNTTIIEADCTRSVVTLATPIPLRCIEKPMHVLWPNHRASLIFIATDQDGNRLNISFNANRDEQPTLRRYVMKLSDVRFGQLETPESWTKFTVKGTCEILLEDDAGSKVASVKCLAKASKGLAVFDFSTGPGAAIKRH